MTKRMLLIVITIIFVILPFINPFTVYANMLASDMTNTNSYIPYSYGENEEDLPPKAILKVRNNSRNLDQLSGTTKTVFTFDGNGSTDEETSTYFLEVRFDFEDDGQVDTYFSTTKTEKHIYTTPGLKTVRMEVLDRAGNVSSTTQKIYVVENTKPDAYFSIEPKIGTPATQFFIDGSLSSDSQYRRSLLKYR
ncbi:PKD domain-containing protein, partial [bacterium]|nr:PKD domain-containing protein [bacterium]